MLPQVLSIGLCALAASVNAAPALAERQLEKLSPYAPVSTSCPSSPLVRTAKGINSQEASYVSTRHSHAADATKSFLTSHGQKPGSSLPVVAFISSGGGYRALLSTAGVVQAFDAREADKTKVAGLYQTLTYQGGLSGGSWFLSSLAANNWPTVSSLKTGLWEQAFQNSLLLPANLLSVGDDTVYAAVTRDIAAKQAAGYNVTIVDPYGRLLSYQLLYGTDGGVTDTLSGLTTLSNFTSHNVPYPIITTTIDFPNQNECYPSLTGPIFEFHPYEYGSWDNGVKAFASSQHMGSKLSNGKPVDPKTCTTNYDNIGYIFGTSSDIFNGIAGGACIIPTPDTTDLPGVLESIVATVESPSTEDLFALYPNPFYKYSPSTLVNNLTTLTLSDGGEADQNNPIWPFIQPARHVDILIVNDNSADTTDNFPNGTEVYQTYLNAQRFGLAKMPPIPPVSTFVSAGLNKRATFFGCSQPDTVFIVYLPNVNYTFPSNQPTSKIEYTVAETEGMIANGVRIATQNGTRGWPTCLACAVTGRSTEGKASKACAACFKEYCYEG